ncbi:type II toxin-antitoxin system PemK/MazF family toxin [bacterium]|nr:type II toxin-antitoxin system PemK/MazF family toxin [bacterium]MCI0604655.1 type II toxin-antitoxin system PemK/MazF family toxin [bacterium]
MNSETCRRGDIWLVNFHPGRGSEQKGVRPALVIQNDTGNQYAATTILAAITTTLKKYPVTVLLDRRERGLREPSMINLAQILTIDKGRLIKKLGNIGKAKLSEVDDAIAVSLGLS